MLPSSTLQPHSGSRPPRGITPHGDPDVSGLPSTAALHNISCPAEVIDMSAPLDPFDLSLVWTLSIGISIFFVSPKISSLVLNCIVNLPDLIST